MAVVRDCAKYITELRKSSRDKVNVLARLGSLLYNHEECLTEILKLGVIDVLLAHAKRSKNESYRVSALIAIGNCCFGKPTEFDKFENILTVSRTVGLVQYLVKLVNDADSQSLVDKGVSSISNLASGVNMTEAGDRGREISEKLKKYGVPAALLPHTSEATKLGANCMRTLANIVGSEELKKGDQSYMHLGPTKLMVDVQTHLLDGDFQYLGTTWSKNTLVQPLSLMAISDSNKPLLVEAGAVEVLSRTVTEWTDPGSLRYCISALLELSFLHEKDEELVASNLFPPSLKLVLDGIVNGKEKPGLDGATKTSAARLLARLEPKKTKERRKSVINLMPMDVTSGVTKHVMMSYCWNNKDGCKALAEALKANGVTTWRDEEGSPLVPPMSGATDEIMAAAIEKSDTVVVCVCRGYKKSANCRFEAKYAQQRLKRGQLKIVYVMMEQDYTTVSEDGVDGWLAFMISDALWYPGWDLGMMANTAKNIVGLIGGEAKAGGVVTPAPTTTDGSTTSSPKPAVSSKPLAPSDAEICKMTPPDVGLWLDATNLGSFKEIFLAEKIGGRAMLTMQTMARKSPGEFMEYQLKYPLAEGLGRGLLLDLCHALCHEGVHVVNAE